MTRNDFELIARALKDTKPQQPCTEINVRTQQWETDIKAIAQMLSNQNARFNFNTFYEACGLELVKK